MLKFRLNTPPENHKNESPERKTSLCQLQKLVPAKHKKIAQPQNLTPAKI